MPYSIVPLSDVNDNPDTMWVVVDTAGEGLALCGSKHKAAFIAEALEAHAWLQQVRLKK